MAKSNAISRVITFTAKEMPKNKVFFAQKYFLSQYAIDYIPKANVKYSHVEVGKVSIWG